MSPSLETTSWGCPKATVTLVQSWSTAREQGTPSLTRVGVQGRLPETDVGSGAGEIALD